ncbi:MAG: hypothetical protein DRI36_01735, partial [Caldiserica bacterium]
MIVVLFFVGLLFPSSDFLLLPINSGSFSLGGINSLSSGVNRNPSSMISSDGNLISFSNFTFPYLDTSFSVLNGIFPYKKSYLGFVFRNFNSSGIRGYDDKGNYKGEFDVKENSFGFGYARKGK